MFNMDKMISPRSIVEGFLPHSIDSMGVNFQNSISIIVFHYRQLALEK